MVKHPKQKGSRFEIIIYDDMKTYFREVKRVGGSGTQKGENGDILATMDLPDESINYCVECKHYKIVELNTLRKWWIKIKKQAAEINRVPLLIYRQNRKDIMVRTVLNFRGKFHLVADVRYVAWKTAILEVRKCYNPKKEGMPSYSNEKETTLNSETTLMEKSNQLMKK